jgi:CheY-like chemotaxis protein
MATVLVADDDPGICAFVTDLLTDAGYAVRCVPDGAAALTEVVRARPDLVLSDIQMPRLDGLALAAHLRPLGVPVVLMSASFFVGVPNIPFVGKPFDLVALLDAVARALATPVA